MIDIAYNSNNNNTHYDYDFIKKNISAKHIKRFANIDYTKENPQFIELIKNIANNQEFSLNEKYNKPYKLANTFNDYINKIYKYYLLCDENAELINQIKEINNKINEHKEIIKKYIDEYNTIETEILGFNAKISNYDTARNNSQVLIDKIKTLTNSLQIFIDISNKKLDIFKQNETKNLYLLKYFDFYIIYISIYIHFAPILNKHYRDKLKLYLSECLENMNCFEDSKTNNDEKNNDKNNNINFIELIYNFFDINGKEKELFMNSSSFSDFIQENFIFMHLFNDKAPLIIDYTQFGKDIINDYWQFEKPHDFLILTFNNYSNNNSNNDINIGNRQEQPPKNEFKEKLEKSTKLGWNLFIDNINDINKIYYLFYNYINKRYIGDRANKNISIDGHIYTINDSFKLFLFKNNYGSININNIDKKTSFLINDNIWFNLLFINFNIPKEDLKEKIFNSISFYRNQEVFNSLKKAKINIVKKLITKQETEKKLIKSILDVDLSGNEEKLNEVKMFNDNYSAEYQLYCECEDIILNLEKKYENQKIGLYENYESISNDCSRIYKWLYKYYLFEISYKINSKSFIHYILEFFDEKFSVNNEVNMNKNDSPKNKMFINAKKKKSNKKILSNKKKIIEEDEDYEIKSSSESDDEYLSSENENDDKNKKNGLEKTENIIPVKKEKYIYNNEKDSKSLIIFIYNKVKNIFGKKEIKTSILLILGFICVNIQNRIPLPFKTIFNNCYLFNNSFNNFFEENDIKKSPIENISDKQWTILDKLNVVSGDLLGIILNNINNNKSKWNTYLNDNCSDLKNYFYDNLKFPDEDLENNTNNLIKFIFFYTIKPEKHEFFIETFLEKNIMNEDNEKYNYDYWYINERYNSLHIKNKYEDYDIIKAFKNYKPKKDHALVLITPHNNINFYDKIIYEYCYLRMFTNNITNNQENQNKTHFGEKTLSNNFNTTNQNINNNQNNNIENSNNNIDVINANKKTFSRKATIRPESSLNATIISGFGQNIQISSDIKYKEIILDNNYSDLNQQDFEYIKNSLRSGNVIVIKNSHFLLNQFNEILKEINDIKYEDISIAFRLILICDINEVIRNKSIYEQCHIINDNLLYEEQIINYKYISVKEKIINIIYKIPIEVYSFILNSQYYFMRLFLRKIIYYYITIFGLLQCIELNYPFNITINDFYFLCNYIIIYFEHENFTEEKFNEFTNIENPSGNNYISFINILDNIFIFSRQIDYQDECKIQKYISELHNYKLFMDPNFYLDLKNIKITVISNDSSSSLNYDLSCEDIYKSFNSFSSEDYEYLLPNISKSELNLKKYNNTDKIFKNIITAINMNYYNEEKVINNDNLDLKKIYKILNNLDENIPLSIIYQISEFSIGLDSAEEINPSMFKKNKYGLYFNSLDNTIYYEVRNFNKKLELFHIQIRLLLSMIKGEKFYNNLFYNSFKMLNNDLIPINFNILNLNEHINKDNDNNENNWSVDLFKRIVIYRINLFKTWLKDGHLKCYHLPLFDNIHLFINDIKIHFCKKYYGENDYSKITPDMINLKFFSTTYSTYEELTSSENNNINYYNNLYNNEIIWVNGLILQNAKLDPDYSQYLIVNKNNEKTNIKMNIIGITYTIHKYENEEDEDDNDIDNNNDEIENTNGNDNHTEIKSNNTESKFSEISETNEIKNDEKKNKNKNNKEFLDEQNRTIKVYIYEKKNRCKYHKYYKENSIGFMEFYVNNDIIDQNYIFEHDIRIIVDEFGDYEN